MSLVSNRILAGGGVWILKILVSLHPQSICEKRVQNEKNYSFLKIGEEFK